MQQDLAILFRYSFVKLALLRDLGEQFRNLSLEVSLYVTNALRNASERAGRVQKRVMIELDERLKRDTQALAVIENRAMVIGNSPWTRIDIEALLEFAGLLEPAEFDERISAPQGPIASPCPAVEFQQLDLVAGLA